MPRKLSIIQKFRNDRDRAKNKRSRTKHAVEKEQSTAKKRKSKLTAMRGRNAWSKVRGHVQQGTFDLYGMKMDREDTNKRKADAVDERIDALYSEIDVPMKELSYYAGL